MSDMNRSASTAVVHYIENGIATKELKAEIEKESKHLALGYNDKLSDYHKMAYVFRRLDQIPEVKQKLDSEVCLIMQSIRKIVDLVLPEYDKLSASAKVSDEEILRILAKYSNLASEATKMDKSIEITNDAELMALVPKVDFEMNSSGYRQIMLIKFSPTIDTTLFPSNIEISMIWNDGDWIDGLFKLKDAKVEYNYFSSDYYC